jgi:energy-coupling factor transporter transmembrane protein EcfT
MPADPALIAEPTAPTHRASHLHPFWRYGLALAWAAALVGLLVPENQGYTLGKQPFWWGGVLLVVAAIGVVVALVLKDWRWAPLASIGMSVVLILLTLPDRAENPGIALKQLMVAAGILLVSIGSLSGWDRGRSGAQVV